MQPLTGALTFICRFAYWRVPSPRNEECPSRPKTSGAAQLEVCVSSDSDENEQAFVTLLTLLPTLTCTLSVRTRGAFAKPFRSSASRAIEQEATISHTVNMPKVSWSKVE